MRDTRYCPKCVERRPRDEFEVLEQAAYVGDGRRRARVYTHTCGAWIAILLGGGVDSDSDNIASSR